MASWSIKPDVHLTETLTRARPGWSRRIDQRLSQGLPQNLQHAIKFWSIRPTSSYVHAGPLQDELCKGSYVAKITIFHSFLREILPSVVVWSRECIFPASISHFHRHCRYTLYYFLQSHPYLSLSIIVYHMNSHDYQHIFAFILQCPHCLYFFGMLCEWSLL